MNRTDEKSSVGEVAKGDIILISGFFPCAAHLSACFEGMKGYLIKFSLSPYAVLRWSAFKWNGESIARRLVSDILIKPDFRINKKPDIRRLNISKVLSGMSYARTLNNQRRTLTGDFPAFTHWHWQHSSGPRVAAFRASFCNTGLFKLSRYVFITYFRARFLVHG
ncbi:hypothetical protein RRG08_033190 [Elysia crispata]|uniref:Uncharacterized protein n=1 Tax=Elysia crispata TaxID=231223 RepID=A0AAE1ECJ2_9GAST|nr:hypothetical protein RRG08_033190 [Elysia crispata]